MMPPSSASEKMRTECLLRCEGNWLPRLPSCGVFGLERLVNCGDSNLCADKSKD